MVKKVLYSAIGVVVLGFVLLLVIGLNAPQPIKQAQESVPMQTPVAVATSSAPDKVKVAAILSVSVDHYAQLFASGKAALGTTQYPNASAGLKAFDDPNSAASKFSNFRKSDNLQNDLSYLDAFKQADSYYTAANEPDAIGTWRDDMTNLTGDLYKWVDDAASWQISEISSAQLKADEQKVNADFAAAKSDVAAISK